MNNNEMQLQSLDDITQATFEQAVYLAFYRGTTHEALLGSSGDTIILYAAAATGVTRCSQVSVRKYNSDAELLITDTEGQFLFYGRFSIALGARFVVEQYWQIFQLLRPKIDTSVPMRNDYHTLSK
jgi:hypothetical protein